LLRRAADALAAMGVGEPAFRVFERLQALSARKAAAMDGPLPPAFLRVLTAGSSNAETFVEQGRKAAAEFHRLACDWGRPLSPRDRVLEFGCGCGRVARWWLDLCPARFDGCDVQGRLIDWCAQNLRGEYRLTLLDPPLPYEAASFDLIYALSVFTHMREPGAVAWLAEMARVLKPGGLALLTFQDDRLPAAAALQPGLSETGFAVRRRGAEGRNLLAGYFTAEGFAARAGPGLELLHVTPSDASAQGQAVAVFRRRAGV
jgi:SAM-dependent methyltransferase